MSDDNEVIKDFTIDYRINEGATKFDITLPTPLTPDDLEDLDTGKLFEYYIYDNTLDTPFVAITGLTEKLKIDYDGNGQIYGFTGRDVGRGLVNQPFSLPCTATLGQQFTVEEALDWILEDTGITIGRGQTPLSKRVVLNTAENNAKRFCDSWNTKVEAINQLFSQYSKISGAKRFRWYINYAGYFRWFETNSERGGKEYIFLDDPRVKGFNVEKDATSIVNVISGTYGDEENQQSITMTVPESIGPPGNYGICVGQDINEQKYTLSQLQEAIQKELDMKAFPLYSGTITFAGFYPYETGTQFMFPDRALIRNEVFTVVDYSIKGVDGNITTTINITTDESAISIVNEFDVIEATAQQVVNDSQMVVGVVTSIPDKNDDRGLVFTPSKTGGVIKNARNPGGQWR